MARYRTEEAVPKVDKEKFRFTIYKLLLILPLQTSPAAAGWL